MDLGDFLEEEEALLIRHPGAQGAIELNKIPQELASAGASAGVNAFGVYPPKLRGRIGRSLDQDIQCLGVIVIDAAPFEIEPKVEQPFSPLGPLLGRQMAVVAPHPVVERGGVGDEAHDEAGRERGDASGVFDIAERFGERDALRPGGLGGGECAPRAAGAEEREGAEVGIELEDEVGIRPDTAQNALLGCCFEEGGVGCERLSGALAEVSGGSPPLEIFPEGSAGISKYRRIAG